MPIKQDRLRTLLEAAEDFVRSREDLITFANKAMKAEGLNTLKDLYSAIYAFAPSTSSLVTIAKERQHYDLTHSRNAQHAEAQRRKRALRRSFESEEGFAQAEALFSVDESAALFNVAEEKEDD